MTKRDDLAEYFDSHDLAEGTSATDWAVVPETPRENLMVTTSMRLPKPIMDEVRAAARRRGVKPTALMREWIEAALADDNIAVPMSVFRAAATEYHHRLAS